MRHLETSLQQFGEFLLTAKLVREKHAPHAVRGARRFLSAPASDGSLADQTHEFGGFLRHLATRQHLSASTQKEAFCALLFLCREVLGFEPDGLGEMARAR